MMKRIAVLLTVYNRRDKTLYCLDRLYRQENMDNYKVDVFLTDDRSTDGTSEAVCTKYPKVHIIKGNGELYWNRGMHEAWKTAEKGDYDFYVWLNDDTFLFGDALSYLLKCSHLLGGYCIVAGATCSKDNHEETTYSGFVRKRFISVNGKFQKVQKFNGNFVLIPKSVFKVLGKNDPYYRHSFGDMDYGLRAGKAGIDCYITDKHIGTCEKHEYGMKCFDTHYSLFQRFRAFYSPLGMNPREFFHMNKQSLGLFYAIAVFITTHIRVFIPRLWK